MTKIEQINAAEPELQDKARDFANDVSEFMKKNGVKSFVLSFDTEYNERERVAMLAGGYGSINSFFSLTANQFTRLLDSAKQEDDLTDLEQLQLKDMMIERLNDYFWKIKNKENEDS